MRLSMTEQHVNTITSEEVFHWWDYPLFIFLTCMKFSVIIYFMWYWFSAKDWWHYPVTFSIMTVMLLFALLNNQVRWFTLLFMRRPRSMVARPGWKVAVITTFVPGAEPIEMLEETLRALLALDYPHDTWVLDEGNTDQVKALCQRLGAHHFSRQHRPHFQTAHGTFQAHSKHGNYNAWLYTIGFDRYDIITAFDPDHIPEPEFLAHVLGYFNDPKVGYVQTAQSYYNQQASFIARGAAEETYAYYSSLQMASYGMGVLKGRGHPEYYQLPQLIGSHNTHRLAALQQIGGFAPHSEVLVPADDLLTTLLYWAYGWQGIYIPRILARGLAPVDWYGYITQQRRWARAILDIKFHTYPKLPQAISCQTRLISILHGLTYLQKSLLIPLSLLLMAGMLITGRVPTVLSYPHIVKFIMLFVILQSFELYRQRFYLNWRKECGLHWRAWVLQFAKWPYMLLALWEIITNHKFPYNITRKVKEMRDSKVIVWQNIFIIFFISMCSFIGIAAGHTADISLYILASMVALLSLLLIVSEYRDFPAPYDNNLQPMKQL